MSLVKIEDGCLVIRIDEESLVTGTLLSPSTEFWNSEQGDFAKVRITDPKAWMHAILSALREEIGEDGTTLVHQCLDRAVTAAIESGAEGIFIEGILT